jgi:hypothetical protein
MGSVQEEKKTAKLSRQGSNRITLLRKTLDDQGYKYKELVVGVDNSYTNKEVLKHLPQRTTLIGRIRKDTKLYKLPKCNPDRVANACMANGCQPLKK